MNLCYLERSKIKILFHGGHIEIMLVIEIETLELMSGHIEIMLFIEIETLELAGGHIAIMIFIEMRKIELFIEMEN